MTPREVSVTWISSVQIQCEHVQLMNHMLGLSSGSASSEGPGVRGL